LRRPELSDAPAIFRRYSSDPEVARYLAWPCHQTTEQTEAFLTWSEAEWTQWPAGPYLVESLAGHELLGSTGLAFESPNIAATGYVLARDAWGRGFATEALAAMVNLATDLGLKRLYAHCHPDNAASLCVLEKCGFTRDSFPADSIFPNLAGSPRLNCRSYSHNWKRG
jgi:RimJ/RimL family protein N-acetyltransferase